MTIDMNYFFVLTILLVILFVLIGFALDRIRSRVLVMGIFLSYVAAQLCASFLIRGLNFAMKLDLGDEILPYFQKTIFLVSVIAVLGFVLGMSYTHTFRTRLAGMLLGAFSGYLVSVFTLEFLRELLAGWPGPQTVKLDFGYALLGQEGLFVLTTNFSSNPEGAYAVLSKILVPAILFFLFLLLGDAFSWFTGLLSKILGAIIGWISITGGKERKKTT